MVGVRICVVGVGVVVGDVVGDKVVGVVEETKDVGVDVGSDVVVVQGVLDNDEIVYETVGV